MRDSRSERIEGETDNELLFKIGQGNWRAVHALNYPVDDILEAANTWKEAAKGIEKPWLVWCAHPEWALIQQRLVEAVGWTPIVGGDPRVKDALLTKTAVKIDFNAKLNLPVMYPHFPIELAFIWIDKLAFWHSDFLIRLDLMKNIARDFQHLKNGSCWVTRPDIGLFRTITGRQKRYWELLGCTTKNASRSQWNHGTGWWMNFYMHPNCPDNRERKRRKRYYFDHGTGVYFWEKKLRGTVMKIPESLIKEGHFTRIGNPEFKRSTPKGTSDSMRSMEWDLNQNINLSQAAKFLNLEKFLS